MALDTVVMTWGKPRVAQSVLNWLRIWIYPVCDWTLQKFSLSLSLSPYLQLDLCNNLNFLKTLSPPSIQAASAARENVGWGQQLVSTKELDLCH